MRMRASFDGGIEGSRDPATAPGKRTLTERIVQRRAAPATEDVPAAAPAGPAMPSDDPFGLHLVAPWLLGI